jgi:hypothetical protein
MRKIAKVVAGIIAVLLSVWTGAKAVLDLIGRVLSAQDFVEPDGLVAKGLIWLFSTPWWVPGALGGGIVLVLAIVLLRTEAKHPTPQVDERGYIIKPDEVKHLVDAMERLFADEHELALTGRFNFGPEVNNRVAPFQHRERFKEVIRALEAPCRELGFHETALEIAMAESDLNDVVDVSQAYNIFHRISLILKSEIIKKVNFVSMKL